MMGMFLIPPSAFVAAGLLSSCWGPAAAHAGLAGGLSGSQETTTRSQAA